MAGFVVGIPAGLLDIGTLADLSNMAPCSHSLWSQGVCSSFDIESRIGTVLSGPLADRWPPSSRYSRVFY